MSDDQQQAPPPSVPPPSAPSPGAQAPVVTARPGPNVSAQVIIDPRQRGTLSTGYGAYAGQGYDPYLAGAAARFREIAQCDPDFITRNAERFEHNSNRSTAFLSEGPYVAQYSQINGRYALGRVYNLDNPADRLQLDQTRGRLAAQQATLDPYTREGIQVRRDFENLSMNDPRYLAHNAHVYPNSVTLGSGTAFLVMNAGGRMYGGKYSVDRDGRFEMQQVFDLQDPTMARGFMDQERAAQNREMAIERGAAQRMGGYGSIPVPYPIGRGGTDIGVVIDRRGTEVGVHVGNRRGGTDVGVVVGTDRRGGVHVGGDVDVRLPGGGRFDIGGIFKP